LNDYWNDSGCAKEYGNDRKSEKATGNYALAHTEKANSPKDEEDTNYRTLLNKTERADYIYHEVINQENHKGRGDDRNRCANDSDKKIHKISSIFKNENVPKSVAVFTVEYAQRVPGSNHDVKGRCLLNYYTNYCTYIKFIKFTH